MNTRRRSYTHLTIYLLAVLTFLSAVQASAQEKQSRQSAIEQLTGHKRGTPEQQLQYTLPDGVKLDDGLSEDDAIAIALWNNAQLHADLATLGLARADLIDAGLLRNPILNLVLPIGPYRQFESLLNFPLEVFWQRRKRIKAASLAVDQVAISLERNALDLIRDVRLAYVDWMLSRERSSLADEEVALRGQIVKLMDVRLRVGDISEIESTAVRLDESLAVERAARFELDIIVSRDRLRGLMGIGVQSGINANLTPQSKSIASFQAVSNTGPPTLDELLAIAYASRPDLRAASLVIEVAAERAKWERSRVVTLAGLLNIKRGEGVPFAPRPGVLIDLPVFNRNQGGIARADAEVERAAWQYLAVRQAITGEVQEAFNQFRHARESLDVWKTQTIPLAEKNARLAGNAFNSGDQSYLFVLDAVRRVVEVRQREAELKADLHRAVAQLDRSLGQSTRRRSNGN